jgi:hypothetical protein
VQPYGCDATGEGLDCHVALRLAPEERDDLRRIAAAGGTSVSELLREAVRILIEADREERREAARASNPFLMRAARRG